MLHKIRRLPLVRAGLACAALALAAPALAQDGGAEAVLATINGEPVTERDLEMALTDLDPQFSRLPDAQRRAAALSALVEIKLLAAEARERGLDETEAFKNRMAFLRERALHRDFVETEVAETVSEEAVRARYDQEVADTGASNEVRARHILVETREEAEAIIDELDAGGDFEALAKEHSTDGAAAQGGDLGYFGPGQMVEPFEKAAMALEVGSYTAEPVETQFGWHVIKVEDRRVQQPPPFEQVKDQLRSLLIREKYLEAVTGLREAAEIDVKDPALAEALGEITR
ncbi:peptidylprolyl isomerase [Aquibium sp. A9E412]|uniref:peptidylprolyl isomerase n=1 Tax=Aquibium sp. A9E412 TaxID=2976767 RepID=UPI0025AEDE00|nr:peptidylprolyl isomerase [Aquibium sp. A9E412]MDN2566502.1 peptidylprolyl isomerase [Aquibium sp. A9E412]